LFVDVSLRILRAASISGKGGRVSRIKFAGALAAGYQGWVSLWGGQVLLPAA